jgi:TonB-dependent receptor
VSRSGGEASKVVLRGMSDRFSCITIDGVRISPTDADSRGVDLSAISQGSLAGIELYKALTSDMDADAIAGSVNLVTKKAPSKREIRLDTKGAYNDLNSTYDQYDFQLKYGERFFDDFLGVQVTGNLEQRDRSKENFDIDYSTAGFLNGSNYYLSDATLEFTDEMRKRKGLSVLLDIETPDGGVIKLSNIYNSTNRDYIEYNRNYPTDGAELYYGARNREQDIETFNSSLNGENHLFGFKVDWSLSFSQSTADYPFDYELNFLEPSSLDNEGNPISGMMNVPSEYSKGPIEEIQKYALNNFSRAFLYTGYYRTEKNLDKEKTAILNLSRDYTISKDISGTFKFGGKYRDKTRYRERSELLSPYYVEAFPAYVKTADGTLVPKNFSGTPFAGLESIGGASIPFTYFLDTNPENRNIYDKYNLYPLMNQDKLKLWWELNQNGYSTATNPEYEVNQEATASNYDITERVTAGYVMNTFNIGQNITFIAGIRAEIEANDYASKYSPTNLSGFPTPKGAIEDTTATHYETVWLPNFQLSFRPLSFMNVRVAAYRALARPDFNDRLENFVPRSAGTFYQGNSLIVGNPRLKAAKAWNFEINTSFFGNDIGLISLSAFYKDIKDMYQLINGVTYAGQAPLDSLGITWQTPFSSSIEYNLRYPYNSSKPTRVWGFEIEHQANFRFLPGLLKNIVLSYNLSIVRSETYVPTQTSVIDTVYNPPRPPRLVPRYVNEERKQKLQGQPEFFGNVALGYDIGGFSGRVSLFYQSEYNSSFSATGRGDGITAEFTKIDIALKQELFDFLAVMLNLNNITNVKEETITANRITGWQLLNTSQTYGFTADLGVRITL